MLVMPSLRRQDLPSELTNPQSETTKLLAFVGDLSTRDPQQTVLLILTNNGWEVKN